MISQSKQKAIIEAMLFVSPQPVTLVQMVRRIRSVIRKESQVPAESSIESIPSADPSDAAAAMAQLLEKQKELEDDITKDDIKALLREIQAGLESDDHGIELVNVAKGYQLRTKYDVSIYLRDDQPESLTRLSPSSLETLAIIAYQQPLTRQKIEEVRGVDCGGVLKTLLEKEFIRIVGRSDEPGKPLVYGSSQRFLEVFGLASLKELPSLEDFKELSLGELDDREGEADEDARILPPEDIEPVSLSEVDVMDISEAEQAILNDLDSSLKNLKDVEKRMNKPEIGGTPE